MLRICTFLLILCSALSRPADEPCIDNVVGLNLQNKTFYLGIHFKANYFEATEFCRYSGMRLATINNQEENDRLFEFLKQMGAGEEHVWISGSDLGHEGKFVWMSTGAPLTYKNFMPGQPDNAGGKEHCLEIRVNGRWNDFVCDFQQHFVCEF